MQQALHRSSLVPRGFVVESAYYEGDKAIVVVRASGSVGLCPSCGAVSRRVHSRYRRRVTDLPLSGRTVQLIVIARRFRCDAVLDRPEGGPTFLHEQHRNHSLRTSHESFGPANVPAANTGQGFGIRGELDFSTCSRCAGGGRSTDQ